MKQKAWPHLENRVFLIILLVIIIFLLSAIGENTVQRSSPDYVPIGRGY